jgi:TRAP-type C4-dicarboxylate transport system permease small subunit
VEANRVGRYRECVKRSLGGGAHRGPVAHARQRRAIRIVQALLVLCAAGLLLFAGYTWGLSSGYDRGKRTSDIDPPSTPSTSQTLVLGAVALVALGAALALQGSGVRIPVPARLDDPTAHAEREAVARAERAAESHDG